jgi:sulfur transfer protein SufE
MDINQLTENFKNFDELKVFCESQFRQLLNLSKKNKELEDKISELNKKIKEQNKQELIQASNNAQNVLTPDFKVLDDAKTISQVQLKLLKEASFDRELTLEEAKRVEIFNRILNEEKKDDKKTLKADAKVLKEEDLLKLIENGN